MASAIQSGSASDQLRQLAGRLEQHDGFAECLASLTKGRDTQLSGVWGASRALVAAVLAGRSPSPLVVVCPHPDDCDAVCDDLALLAASTDVAEGIARFPAWQSDPGEQVLYDEIYGDRLRLLKRLVASDSPAHADRPAVIVTSIQSLLQRVPDRPVLAAATRRLTVGEPLEADELARWLAEHGFQSTTAVELPGEFSRRGGILDVFAPDWNYPVRIELFGDEIESLRHFEVASQRSLQKTDVVDVTVLSPGEHDSEHLCAYLPADSWFQLIEPADIEEEGRHYLERLERPQQFHSVRQVMQQLARFASITCESVSAGSVDTSYQLPIESVERFSGDVDRVRSELDAIAHGQNVYVVCETEAEAKRLAEVFSASQLAAESRLHFPVGRLSAGFRWVTEDTIVLSGREMFQRVELPRGPRRRLGRVIDSFLELREGDLVVHLAHGIGRYRGLKLLEKEGRSEEHLELEFYGGTKIYVPASRIELVQKYVGGSKARVSLARIGGKTWERQKQAAQRAVADLASDMIELQAQRAAQPGIRYPEDSTWQLEFDASFPFSETPDQLLAIEAIKNDMQRSRPMDRLLCGDVGFGKTELAIRAAFKAIDNGYQVAVLVPTTILAEQHRRTFCSRMAEFPFEIASLSRFATKKQQREVIEKLEAGKIDIVVGTHRLAQKDVRFANPGLVIIDEEQRFGVEVKERLKSLRTTVDVLTMTATPIPRTLHLSLLGVKDISNLETPPEDRLAVETRVSRFNDALIRHAILRELNRGGQVYFVHNRVHDIEAVARRLGDIVPEARLDIAHGQMPERHLERVMLRFVDRQFDVLLATTIVESGLDIPTTNTIFIDDADRYGLADLHQLRGRVGRYKHRAYCYLLIDEKKHISPEAARRLRAIEEFSDLGAGFSIAIRDLELRGAGNILGTQQSGHLAAVGYELYCALLDKTVRRLKHLPPKETVDVAIDLPGDAYLPRNYVADMRTKIELYRRWSRITDEQQLADFAAELVDRFGPRPESVEQLLSLGQLRLWAHKRRIRSIHTEDGYVVLTFGDETEMGRLRDRSEGRLRLVDQQTAYLPIRSDLAASGDLVDEVKSLLRPV